MNPLPRFELYGGKGGVGKTTHAAARAIGACDEGARVLVVSTDPAHSLGDALDARVGPKTKAVRVGKRTMHAMELDADAALARWMRARRSAFRAIAERGTYLDRRDIDRLMDLSLPGVDELAALLELRRIADRGRWDVVVVDTAPTGHTLRLLETPEALTRIARVLDEMQAKHRLLFESLAGAYRPDDADEVIEEIASEARALRGMLRDASRCGLTWVTLPEPMAVAESRDALSALDAMGVRVGRIVVNRVAAARYHQKTAIAQIRRAWPDRDIVLVPNAAAEPRGVAALRALHERTRDKATAMRNEEHPSTSHCHRRSVLPCSSFLSTPLLFFGGKGGVGKTTCAAAAAVAIAKRGKKVLLLSTDPAHSVADALGIEVGDRVRAVPGAAGMFARELDAQAAFAAERRRYRDAIDDVFRALVRSPRLDATYDRVVMQDLVDLAPPGIDEVFAMVTLTDEIDAGRWESIVVDTAPTGHTLRLLAMPEAARAWVHALLAILLEYRKVLGLGEVASDLLAFAKRLRAFEAALHDPARTSFVAVTRAEELARLETMRLLSSLARSRVAAPLVVVNCVHGSAQERASLARLRRALRSSRSPPRAIVLAPAAAPPPCGVGSLAAWTKRWTE